MIECNKCGNSYAMRYLMYHFHRKTPYCKECLEKFVKDMNRRKTIR